MKYDGKSASECANCGLRGVALTNKNTKKGQKVRKIIALSALKNGYYAFACGESCSTSYPKSFF